MTDELRDYQQKGIDFLVSKGRAILADDMGLGKSRQALEAAINITSEGPLNRVMIIGTKVGIYVWLTEIGKWFPELLKDVTVVIGPAAKRHQAIQNLLPPYILITTYDILRVDNHVLPRTFDLIIADEAHKLRNRKTATYKAFRGLATRYLFFLTGTPASRGPQDLWTMLHLLNPKSFTSYWRFVNTWCHVFDGQFGKEIAGPKNVEALKEMLSQYLLRRPKDAVGDQLPPKTRQILPAELSTAQKKVYKTLCDEMLSFIDGATIIAQTPMVLFLRLRQLLVAPQVLELPYAGGGIEAICDHIEDSEDYHCAIFTPFAQALPHLEEYIRRRFKDINVVHLKGGMSPDAVKETIETFKLEQCIVLCTIKFAQSFSLETASRGYFLGYEFNPDENHQAEDRLHRLTSLNPVHIYYVQYKNTVDERVLEILNIKNRSVTQILAKPEGLKHLLLGD